MNTSKVKLVILDEADRMLEMGFIEDVEKIIQTCPKERQSLFFSATISREIEKLAKDYMISPELITAKKMVDPKKLKQVYYDTPRQIKFSLLVHLLKKEESGLVMVFCNTRRNTDFIVKELKRNDIDAIAIHGGLSQNKRTRTLQTFNKGRAQVLVCTDVAARGLHIDDVSHVYNYDIPASPTDYVHRIGRTARAGENGIVINILCAQDHDNFSRILNDYDFNIKKEETPDVKRIFVQKLEERPNRGRRPQRRFPRRR